MKRYEYGKTLKARIPEDRLPVVLPVQIVPTLSPDEIAERYRADREIEDITVELDWDDRWPPRPR